MVSSPIKYGDNFSPKKLSMGGGGTFLDKFMENKFKSCLWVYRWRRGELVWPGNNLAEEVCLERLTEGNCLWCLAITVIFIGLGGAKGLGGLGGI